MAGDNYSIIDLKVSNAKQLLRLLRDTAKQLCQPILVPVSFVTEMYRRLFHGTTTVDRSNDLSSQLAAVNPGSVGIGIVRSIEYFLADPISLEDLAKAVRIETQMAEAAILMLCPNVMRGNVDGQEKFVMWNGLSAQSKLAWRLGLSKWKTVKPGFA